MRQQLVEWGALLESTQRAVRTLQKQQLVGASAGLAGSSLGSLRTGSNSSQRSINSGTAGPGSVKKSASASWELFVDESTGNGYYYNVTTGASSWAAPREPGSGAGGGGASGVPAIGRMESSGSARSGTGGEAPPIGGSAGGGAGAGAGVAGAAGAAGAAEAAGAAAGTGAAADRNNMHRTRSASAPVDDLFSMSSSPAKLLGKGGSGSGRSGMTVLEEEGGDDDDDEGDSINRSFRHSFPVEPSSSLVGPPPGPPGLPGPPPGPPGPPGPGGLLPMSPGGSRPTLRRQIGLRRHGNNHVDTAKQFQKPSLNAIRGGFRRVFAKKKRKEAEAKGGGNHFTIALSSVPRSPEGIPVVLLELRRLILCNDGLDVEGIFRVAPDKAELNQAKEVLDATGTLSSPDSGADTDKCDVHIAATLIKDIESAVAASAEEMAGLLSRVPEPQGPVLLWLLDFMGEVVAKESKSRMSAKNVAIVVAPNLSDEFLNGPANALEWTRTVTQFTQHALECRIETKKRALMRLSL
eukprot:g1945.t1